MAFLNRVSNLLKKSGSKHVVSGFTASNASLFQAIRSMSSAKLFVGGISYETDDMSLKEAFSQYGEVIETRVILDRDTGRSRGFAFVTFTSTEASSSAIQALDGQDLHGRRIRVNYATERARSPGFGGFGGGNYGGQGGYQGGGYPAGDGNYGGGYGGGNQYRRGGGGYGGGNDYDNPAGGFGGNYGGGYGGTSAPNVGGGSYTGGDHVQGGDNFGSGGNNYFSGSSTGPTGADGELLGAVPDLQDVTNAEGFEDDMSGENRDDDNDDLPDDYANTRR